MESYAFKDLEALRHILDELIQRQVPSLEKYYDSSSNGFRHRYEPDATSAISKSSTATCVLSVRKRSGGPGSMT